MLLLTFVLHFYYFQSNTYTVLPSVGKVTLLKHCRSAAVYIPHSGFYVSSTENTVLVYTKWSKRLMTVCFESGRCSNALFKTGILSILRHLPSFTHQHPLAGVGQPAYLKSGTLGTALNLILKVSPMLRFSGFRTGSSNNLQPFYLNRKKLFSLQDTSSVMMHYKQMAPESTSCNLGTDLLHSRAMEQKPASRRGAPRT